MERLEADDLAQATAEGRARLENNPYKASYAVLIVDAHITLSSGKTDAQLQAIMESFWKGVDTHEKAADVWNRHLDQSQ
jgi:hypothetical protein